MWWKKKKIILINNFINQVAIAYCFFKNIVRLANMDGARQEGIPSSKISHGKEGWTRVYIQSTKGEWLHVKQLHSLFIPPAGVRSLPSLIRSPHRSIVSVLSWFLLFFFLPSFVLRRKGCREKASSFFEVSDVQEKRAYNTIRTYIRNPSKFWTPGNTHTAQIYISE